MSVSNISNAWLHKGTLTMLVWLYSFRFFHVNRGTHECVKGFPESVLSDVLGSDADNVPIPYRTRSHVWSPHATGVPTSCERMYVDIAPNNASADNCKLNFSSLFAEPSLADVTVFFCASRSMIDHEIAQELRRQDMDCLEDDIFVWRKSPLDIMLSPSETDRMMGFYRFARLRDTLSSDNRWNQSAAVVNVAQTVGFAKSFSEKVMPTLLRKSILVDLVRESPVWACEHFLIQGFPYPGYCEATAEAFFPCPRLVCMRDSVSPESELYLSS